MTIPKPLPPVSLQDQAWFAGVLVLYALVELSFNHRMLELTDVVLSNMIWMACSFGAASLRVLA